MIAKATVVLFHDKRREIKDNRYPVKLFGKIAKKLEIKSTLSTYTARHSYATVLE
jgi:site-specific recombinase XerD